MIKSLNWPTAITTVVGVVGVVVLAYLKVDNAVLGGYAATFISIAGAMEKLYGKKQES